MAWEARGRRGEQRYNLAQYARRVGITEGRARALYTHRSGSRLAVPDGEDPDGKPYWYASTIDAWCQQTDRQVPPDAQWPLSWDPADTPAPEVARQEVAVESAAGELVRVSVIVWDTPRGHVVYVMRHDDEPTVGHAAAARVAAKVLHPVFWAEAVVLVPDGHIFGSAYDDGEQPEFDSIEAYRLVQPVGRQAPQSRRRLPRFLAVLDDDPAPGEPEPAQVRVERLSYPWVHSVAEVLGRPLPMWFYGTCTRSAVARMPTDGSGTIVVPDTATGWSAVRDRFAAAADAEMPNRFPQAFAVLAGDAVAALGRAQRQHATARERGDGWYIVARPERPVWPVTLEHLATTAAAQPFDADAAAAELPDLRADEAQQPWDSSYAEALLYAARVIGGRLHLTHPEVVFAAATPQHLDTGGPVTDQYLRSLTRLPDDERTTLVEHPTRRLVRLLVAETSIASIRENRLLDRAREDLRNLYRDPAGHLVAEPQAHHEDGMTWLSIEWPTGLPPEWTERTVVAADAHRPALVVALTPSADGGLRVDLLPNPGGEPGFTWGYSGSGPTLLYQALVRCVLRDWSADPDDDRWLIQLTGAWRHPENSPLYHYLTTHDGPLRLPWPQVQQWVHTDAEKIRHFTS